MRFHFLQNFYGFYLVNCSANILKDTDFSDRLTEQNLRLPSAFVLKVKSLKY